MQARLLDLDRPRDVRAFLRLPFALYRRDPLWVPPLLADARRQLDRRKHPYYRHSVADAFLVERDGRAIGRILVMENRPFNAHTGRRAAMFGFFECIDDVTASSALFEAAFAWARARGLDEMLGPRELGPTSSGILVQGFEHPPAMTVAYNPPYYEQLLLAAGFEKDGDAYSGRLPGDYRLDPRVVALADRVMARRGLRVKSFASKAEMRAWVGRVGRVYNEAFAQNRGFYPLTQEEFRELGEALIAISDPPLMKLVLRGEEVVGFLFAYRNINEGLRRARGRLWPVGWWHILRARRITRMLDINGIGFVASCRGVGGDAILFAELQRTVGQDEFDVADIVLVDETNARSRADMEAIGVQWYKTHRTYRRAL